MNTDQLTNYLLIALIIIVAISKGISTTLDYVQAKSKKPLPKQLMTIDEIAKFVVDEAATLDATGAEKKLKAVQDLLDQAKAEGKPITKEVAKGAVQNAYNKLQKTTPENKSDEEAKPIGFVSGSDSDD